MEKRTLLAIALSFLVLVIYGVLVPKSPFLEDKSKNLQLIDNKIFIDNSDPDSKAENFDQTVFISNNSLNEKFFSLESEDLFLEFSNLGGNLRKVLLKHFNFSLPVTNILSIHKVDHQIFDVEENSDDLIVFTFEDKDYRVRKTYRFKDKYLIFAEILFLDKSKMSKNEPLEITNFRISPVNLDNKEVSPDKNYLTDKGLLEYVISTPEGIFRKDNAYVFNSKEKAEKISGINWMGFRERYFAIIAKPEYPVEKYTINPIEKYILDLNVVPKESDIPGSVQNFNSIIFIGPQDHNILKNIGLGFEQILNFKIGGFMDFLTFGMTDFLTKLIIHILNFLYQLFHNWGFSIIILGILIFVCTYPLTIKSMASMKKMQVLQPEITKIREQNKNNPEKMNKEMMELYKKHRFNPFGGCLPMFLQMPIFVSLYQVLWRSFSFKEASFLWIRDLSEPDRLFVLPYSIPFLGNEVNLLPFLVMLAMFLQQKFSMKSFVGMDSAQAAQQKMMSKFIPIMIAVLFYRVASGLCLYFTTFYFLSTLAQWKMSKSD